RLQGCTRPDHELVGGDGTRGEEFDDGAVDGRGGTRMGERTLGWGLPGGGIATRPLFSSWCLPPRVWYPRRAGESRRWRVAARPASRWRLEREPRTRRPEWCRGARRRARYRCRAGGPGRGPP